MGYAKAGGIILCFLLLTSCATTDRVNHPSPPDPTPPVNPLYPDITPANQAWVDKAREYSSIQNYIKVGNSSLNEGYQMHRGADRIMALRMRLMQGEGKSPSDMAFIGSRVSTKGDATIKDLKQCDDTSCSDQDLSPDTAEVLAFNTNGYFLLWTPLSNTTSYFGFGTGSRVFNYAILPVNFGGGPRAILNEAFFKTAMKAHQDSNVSSLTYTMHDGMRFEKTQFANKFINSSSALYNQNFADLKDPYEGLSDIASNINSYLNKDSNNIFIASTGTMTQYFIDPNDQVAYWRDKSDKTGVVAINTDINSNGAYSFYFESGADVNHNFGVSGGESLITGDIVKWLQKNGNSVSKNNIAMALGVNKNTKTGPDYTYTPFTESMLPGSLREYAFSIPMTGDFGKDASSSGTIAKVDGISSTRGAAAASILAGEINTLSMWYDGNNNKAIAKLRSDFTHKQYGEPAATGYLSSASGKLYNIESSEVINKIEGIPLIQAAIVRYFKAYGTEVKSPVTDPSGKGSPMLFWEGMSDTEAWDAVTKYYKDQPHLLAQFITNSDVIVMDDDNNKILSMNGYVSTSENEITKETVKYAYYDADGKYKETTQEIYYQGVEKDENGNTKKDKNGNPVGGTKIASNIFGNGIVDFSMIFQTDLVQSGSKFSSTKAYTSSIMGDALQRKGTFDFLSNVAARMGSVYGDNQEITNLSLNGQIEGNINSAAKTEMALNNFFNDDINESRENFHLGFMDLSFNVSSLYGGKTLNTSSAQKKKLITGIASAGSRFGEETSIAEKNYKLKFNEVGNRAPYSGNLQDFSVSLPIYNHINISALIAGQSVNNLSSIKVRDFSLVSRKLGFRDGYSGFLDLFSENVNIQGISANFNTSDSSSVNFITAQGVSANSFAEHASSKLGAVEVLKNIGSSYVKLSSGIIADEKKYLGSYGSGGLSVNSSRTSFIEGEAKIQLLDNYYLSGGVQYGITTVSTEAKKVLSDFSSLYTAGLNVGISKHNFFGGVLGFNYSEALRIVKGTAEFNNGNEINRFSVSPEGRERNIELAYFTLLNDYNIKASLIHTKDLNNIRGQKQNLAVLKFRRLWN